ncbi:uncharacterized protein LOC121370948 [Gigantopelta aegis]|uniref:uncharacterized protein LOC121370948 n=1 Tax=Gigantopelta aegis TaxID=1735272 RepID=UPI001B8882C1|nr:uncharacterized protein LOC121370948 [Gigantopelta aegis]
MKRREFVSEYDGAKRPRSRRDWSDDGWNSDDSVNRHKLHKENKFGGPDKWNEDEFHRIHSHKKRDESTYKGDRRSKEVCATSLKENNVDDTTLPLYKDLCISYIPSRIPNSDLEDGLLIEFEKYGHVSVKIISEGVDRLAYIRFAQPDDAKRAYNSIELHPLLLDSRKVEVKPCFKQIPRADGPFKKSETIGHGSRSRRSSFDNVRYDKRSISPKPASRAVSQYDATRYANKHFSGEEGYSARTELVTPTRVLFVGNLPPYIQRNILQTIFEEYGRIEDIDIKHNTYLGQSKTFAFIKFSDIDSAKKARDVLQNSYIGDRQCKIGYGQMDVDVIREKEARVTNTKESTSEAKYKSLVVRPIPNHVLVSHLQETFEGFGSMNIVIVTVENERIAYVNFQYPEDAKAAHDGSQNLKIAGKSAKVAPFYKSDGDAKEDKKSTDHKLHDHFNKVDDPEDKTKLDVHDVKYSASETPTRLLFVGNLDTDVMKHDLMNTFGKFGSIENIDIKSSKLGRSYALLKFKSLSSSEKANKDLFGKKIGSSVCKLGYGRIVDNTDEDGSEKRYEGTQIKEKKPRITGLCFSQIPKSASDKLVKSVIEGKYKSFFKSRHTKVTVKMSGNYKVAFVDFQHTSQATKALNAKIPLRIMKRPVKISPVITLNKHTVSQKTDKETVATKEDTLEPELDEKATRTLFVGNLPGDITEKEVHKKFGEYGQIEFITIKRPKGNTSYAFVKYANMDYAFKAKVEMNGKMFKECKVTIGYGKSEITSCLWVGGLGPWVKEETIRKEFRRFGEIRRMIWLKGSNFAYVQYETNDAAQAACHKFHGWPMGGLDKRLRVDFVSVKQILTALAESKKTSSKDGANESDKDETGDLSEAPSQTALESESALESEPALESLSSLESEAALSVSNISDDSLSEDFISPRNQIPDLTRSRNSASRSPSVHSYHESLGDEGSGIWAQPSEGSLIIKTPFSPADEISQSERTVFVQSKNMVREYDNYMHHQSHHRKRSTGSRGSQSPRGVGESLQREIKHYRRESGLPKHLAESYDKGSSRPNDLYNDNVRHTDSYNDRPAGRDVMYRREQETRQYAEVPVAKQYTSDEEHGRRKERQKYHESSLYKQDYAERDDKFRSNTERLDDFEKSDHYERRNHQSSHDLSPGYASKSIEYGHGIRNFSSGIKENTANAGVGVSPNVLGCERSFQYESLGALNRPVLTRTTGQEPVAAYKNQLSGSNSLEYPKTVNRLPTHENPSSGINPGHFERRPPPVFSYPNNQRPPMSYDDPAPAVRQTQSNKLHQPFQQPTPERNFVSQGNTSNLSNPRIPQMNGPRMSASVQTPQFPVGPFPQRPVMQRMPPSPVNFSRTEFSHLGQRIQEHGAEGLYSMISRPQRNQPNPKGPGTLPWHIQQ